MNIVKSERIEMTRIDKRAFDEVYNMADRLVREVTDPNLRNILANIVDNIADLEKYIEEVVL